MRGLCRACIKIMPRERILPTGQCAKCAQKEIRALRKREAQARKEGKI